MLSAPPGFCAVSETLPIVPAAEVSNVAPPETTSAPVCAMAPTVVSEKLPLAMLTELRLMPPPALTTVVLPAPLEDTCRLDACVSMAAPVALDSTTVLAMMSVPALALVIAPLGARSASVPPAL